MKTTVELNEANFAGQTGQTTQPVIVDFWAPWCGPCRMLAPVLDEVARELEGRAVVAKVNVDENPGLAARFNIQSIPTLLFFKEGQERGRTTGAVSRKAIVTKLADLESPAAAPAQGN